MLAGRVGDFDRARVGHGRRLGVVSGVPKHPDGEGPGAFVAAFHESLTDWFSGAGPRETVWSRLVQACPASMVLIYPSGTRLSGGAFLETIETRFGSSPGFEAWVTDVEVVHLGEASATVAYVEAQTGARSSADENRRSALAALDRVDGRWRWRFIQETAMPSSLE